MASKKKIAGIAEAVGTGAVLAAAAGYYFYGTKNAKKHRHAASAWAKSLKKDVTKQAGALKKIDAKSIGKIVDQASKSYHSVKGASISDVQTAAKELKTNWKMIEKELVPSKKVRAAVKKATATATRTAKTVKKAVAKAAPKKAAKTSKKK